VEHCRRVVVDTDVFGPLNDQRQWGFVGRVLFDSRSDLETIR
jgi:hypothetical protein